MLQERQCGELAGGSVGFVPTMGALHAGHLSLVQLSRAQTDKTVVSIFVNPTQFAEGEDYAQYPRTMDEDLAHCEAAGVSVVFCPPEHEMYPADASVRVVENRVARDLCGAARPGHFTGVCTVVAKLFHLVAPDVAVFGEKDAQQLAVIRRMVRDLFFPVRIVGGPIIREPDGLALSSRNVYLSASERAEALGLYQMLCWIQLQYEGGALDANALAPKARRWLAAEYPGVALEYLAFRDPDTLEKQTVLQSGVLVALAGRVGQTRLIDNIRLA